MGMTKRTFAVSQTITYQIEVEAANEDDAIEISTGFDIDRWEVVDCSQRDAQEIS